MLRILMTCTALIAAGSVGAMGIFKHSDQDAFAKCRAGQVAGGTIGGPFELIDATGKTVTDTDVITGPSLLYFGYTMCPDVCPTDTARNVAATQLLEERGVMLTPFFISIDPERDTPEIVGDFAANLHPRMVGLTGSPEQVKAASNAYRTYYAKQANGDPEYYLVDHSTQSYLVLPQHGFVEFFDRNTSPQDMADRIACFIDAAK